MSQTGELCRMCESCRRRGGIVPNRAGRAKVSFEQFRPLADDRGRNYNARLSTIPLAARTTCSACRRCAGTLAKYSMVMSVILSLPETLVDFRFVPSVFSDEGYERKAAQVFDDQFPFASYSFRRGNCF